MDPFLLWLSFAVVIFLHWFDFKSIFIKGDSTLDIKNKELIDAILLSYQYCFLWFKIMSSLKATKVYGGFMRYIEICLKKMHKNIYIPSKIFLLLKTLNIPNQKLAQRQ